jgi:hypothetical protein
MLQNFADRLLAKFIDAQMCIILHIFAGPPANTYCITGSFDSERDPYPVRKLDFFCAGLLIFANYQ